MSTQSKSPPIYSREYWRAQLRVPILGEEPVLVDGAAQFREDQTERIVSRSYARRELKLVIPEGATPFDTWTTYQGGKKIVYDVFRESDGVPVKSCRQQVSEAGESK